MELILDIYENGKIKKTYKANEFMLLTGICEDILRDVNIDKLTSGKLTNDQLGIEIIKIVAKNFPKFRPFLQDVFFGLTEDEYRHTSIKDVGKVIFQIVQYTVNDLYSIGTDNKKN